MALFLLGPIKLAAAGVKAREGMRRGVVSLASGAADHFREVSGRLTGARYCGLETAELAERAAYIEHESECFPGDHDNGPRILFDFVLRPEDADR